MNKDVTYCCNKQCKNKNKCWRFKIKGHGQELSFAEFDPENCGEC